MRIGELASKAGVSVRAVRYYEEQGLLEAERSRAGQRQFPESAVSRVAFVQDMYAAGLNSRNIAILLPCIETGHSNANQRQMLHSERERIRRRSEQLQSALRRLDQVIAVTDEHV
jgi:DNA-binding transcriptional MerR regulator